MSVPISQFIPTPPPPLASWHSFIYSLHLCLYFCFANRFICSIFFWIVIGVLDPGLICVRRQNFKAGGNNSKIKIHLQQGVLAFCFQGLFTTSLTAFHSFSELSKI